MSWQVSTLAVLALALAVGFAWFERERPPARVVALVAALAALAVVGRLAFAAIPNVKPTTDIVLFAGYALGAAPGFAVGAVTAAGVEHLPLPGPLDGLADGGLGRRGCGRRAGGPGGPRAGSRTGSSWRVCARWPGLAFGAWMDVYQWTLAARQDLDSYLAVSATSLPYNLAHAVGNFLFCLLIGPAFVRALRRYRRRLEVRWSPAPPGWPRRWRRWRWWAGARPARPRRRRAPPTAPPATSSGPRTTDGGFGAAPGQRSSDLYSGWAGLGLAAGGQQPARPPAAGRAVARLLPAARARSLRRHRRGGADDPAAEGGRPAGARLRRPRPVAKVERAGAPTGRSAAS